MQLAKSSVYSIALSKRLLSKQLVIYYGLFDSTSVSTIDLCQVNNICIAIEQIASNISNELRSFYWKLIWRLASAVSTELLNCSKLISRWKDVSKIYDYYET
jgi:hypothetical protein